MSASSLKITPFRAISNTLLHIFVVYLYKPSYWRDHPYTKALYINYSTQAS